MASTTSPANAADLADAWLRAQLPPVSGALDMAWTDLGATYAAAPSARQRANEALNAWAPRVSWADAAALLFAPPRAEELAALPADDPARTRAPRAWRAGLLLQRLLLDRGALTARADAETLRTVTELCCDETFAFVPHLPWHALREDVLRAVETRADVVGVTVREELRFRLRHGPQAPLGRGDSPAAAQRGRERLLGSAAAATL